MTKPGRTRRRLLALVALTAAFAGCGSSGVRTYPLRAPLEVDPDRREFARPPAEYVSGLYWDGADQMFFRPFTRLWAVDPKGESTNVNALDEVPDSSWWTNRVGREPMTVEQARQGPCADVPPLDENRGPWEVFKAKPNGATPGFFISAPDGRKYLFKTDGTLQPPRPTAADVIGSRVYWLVGYNAPCNRVVFVPRSLFIMKKGAKSEDTWGAKVPMTERDIDTVLAKGMRTTDGRYRGSVSLLVDGEILGPFRYEGTRGDDPNDVVPHEDRRELRASQLVAGLLNHTDAREQNTLDTWVRSGPAGGYVRHYMLDFSDCLGTVWDPPALGRRLGHSSYFDIVDVTTDLATFGLVKRPWENKRFGPSHVVLGYYDIDHYDPDSWQPGYDNPAMLRRTERDAAWMARIIARIDRAKLEAIIDEARLGDPFLEREVLRLLYGRQRKILDRFLSRLSPLSRPVFRVSAERGAQLCLDDVAVVAGVVLPNARSYGARAWTAGESTARNVTTDHAGATVCVTLPAGMKRAGPPRYVIIDITARRSGASLPPARVHLYGLGGSDYRIVGLERPASDPGLP
jgi:hypothetical protein